MPDDQQAILRRQFQRRFAFGLNAVILLIISLVLFFLALTHPLNIALLNGQTVWAGYARPDLMYAGAVLLGVIGLHGVWLAWQERKLKLRGLRFVLHLIGTLVTLGLSLTFLNSWYFNESHKWIAGYTPVSSGAPTEVLTITLLLLTIILLVTLPLHGIRLLYQTLLEGMLQPSNSGQTKPKRSDSLKPKRGDTSESTPMPDDDQLVVGDDGELSDWAEHQLRTNRLS